MKTLFALFTMAIASSNVASANTLSLQSLDHTQITLGYEETVTPPNEDSTSTYVSKLSINLSNIGNSSTAVITASCGGVEFNNYTYLVICTGGPGNSNWIQLSGGNCKLDADFAATQAVRFQLPDYLLHFASREGRTNFCHYQLSVVRDGEWLTDPANGTHNFNLNF